MATVPAPGTTPPVPPVVPPKVKKARAPKAAPPVVLPTTAPAGGGNPPAVLPPALAMPFPLVTLIALVAMIVGLGMGMIMVSSTISVDRVKIVDREAAVAAKEAKFADIEDAMGKEVEVVGVKDGTTIVIKRTEEIDVGPRPKVQLGQAFVVPCDEEGEIPLAVPKPQPAASVEAEAPQASAPAKPKAVVKDWPSETIDGVVERVPPPAKKPIVQKRWVFRGRDQYGCEYWEEVPVARPMSAQVKPAARDIRHSQNAYQMR